MDDEDINLEEYGEFICSYNAWLPLEKQKEEAYRMENITKKKNKKKWLFIINFTLIRSVKFII